jgi:hypothetical protein
MARHSFKIASSLALVTAAAGLVLASNTALAVEPVSLEAASPSSSQAEARPLPLHELRTADDRGRFYTINAEEAERAVRHNGFTPTNEAAGIHLYASRLDEMTALHRLRLVDRHLSYLVTTAGSSERQDPRFKDEGVIGYVYVSEQPGTMALHRYNRNGEWRLARAARVDLLIAGFRDDGVIGWVPRG